MQATHMPHPPLVFTLAPIKKNVDKVQKKG